MEKNKAELGDIRIDKFGGQPQICYLIDYLSDGVVKITWRDYKRELIETTPGMCPNCQELHTLDYFRDALALYKIDQLAEEEIAKKREVLEDKIETLLDTFNTETGISAKDVIVWVDNHTKKPVVAVEVEGDI
jgi:hypothetical protein